MSLVLAARFVLLQCGGSALLPSPEARVAPPAPSNVAGAGPSSPAPARGSEQVVSSSVHVVLGVPRDLDPSDDYYLDERAFVLSYNPGKRVANWVAWRLERSSFGKAKRKDDFRPDPQLPERFYRVNESDYRGSGYQRGHLCPSGDRVSSAEENSRTFVFTNIQPQLGELNGGPWEKLERYSRERAKRGETLHIVAGGVFSAPYPTIGKGVAVPAANFKVIVFSQPGQGAADVTTDSEVLAVMMPNQPGVAERAWTEYVTTIDAIEAASGYDFLTGVPERVQRVIEARRALP